jgi:hypothetical protein
MLTSIVSRPNEYAKFSIVLMATVLAPKVLNWCGVYKSLIVIGLMIFAICTTIWAIRQSYFSLKFYFLILMWLSVTVATLAMVNIDNLRVSHNMASVFALLAFAYFWLQERSKAPESQVSPLKVWSWLCLYSLNYGLWML